MASTPATDRQEAQSNFPIVPGNIVPSRSLIEPILKPEKDELNR
jgi:hypothetical protein